MVDHERHDRRDSRRRTVRHAAIVVHPPKPEIPCVILDRSDAGVRLHVHLASEVPDKFELDVPTDERRYACEVVWRQGNELGAKFV